MNKKIYAGIFLFLLMIPVSSHASGGATYIDCLGEGVYLCDDSGGTDCVSLEYDIEDLDNIGYGDDASYLCINAYTSVVLYENDNFYEEENNYESIAPSSSDVAVSEAEIDAMGDGGIGVDSIKVHPRSNVSCGSDTSIDDCLMETAKPILIYDQDEECPDGREIRARVDSSDDGNYKMVSYQIYHAQDCGMDLDIAGIIDGIITGNAINDEVLTFIDDLNNFIDSNTDGWWIFGDILSFFSSLLDELIEGIDTITDLLDMIPSTPLWLYDVTDFFEVLVKTEHPDGDGETMRYLFTQVVDGSDTYWALVAGRYQHHHTFTTKYNGDIPWPLRATISKNKHAQYFSKRTCEDATYRDGTDESIANYIPDSVDEDYEACDAWHVNSDLSYPETGDDGGEILYPDEYSLVDLDATGDDANDFCALAKEGAEEDWQEEEENCDLSATLESAGLLVLQPAEVEEAEPPVETDPDWGFDPANIFSDGESDSMVEYSDIDLTSYDLQSGSSLTAESINSITASNFVIESGATATFQHGGGSGDSVVLSPFFWVERGAEFHVSASTRTWYK